MRFHDILRPSSEIKSTNRPAHSRERSTSLYKRLVQQREMVSESNEGNRASNKSAEKDPETFVRDFMPCIQRTYSLLKKIELAQSRTSDKIREFNHKMVMIIVKDLTNHLDQSLHAFSAIRDALYNPERTEKNIMLVSNREYKELELLKKIHNPIRTLHEQVARLVPAGYTKGDAVDLLMCLDHLENLQGLAKRSFGSKTQKISVTQTLTRDLGKLPQS